MAEFETPDIPDYHNIPSNLVDELSQHLDENIDSAQQLVTAIKTESEDNFKQLVQSIDTDIGTMFKFPLSDLARKANDATLDGKSRYQTALIISARTLGRSQADFDKVIEVQRLTHILKACAAEKLDEQSHLSTIQAFIDSEDYEPSQFATAIRASIAQALTN